MHRYHCHWCGTVWSDESSWARHTNTCFSRTTTCSLCGQTMPTSTRDEHLRILHGIVDRRSTASNFASVPDPAPLPASRAASASPALEQQALSSRRSPAMSVALAIVPAGNPNMRAATKSPALLRVAARSGVAADMPQNSSSMLQAVLRGSGAPMDGASSRGQSPAPSPSAAAGFSFRSDDALLRRAGTPERTKQLLLASKRLVDERRGSTDGGGGAATASAIAGQSRLQVVEDVVHNILSHSPRRVVNGAYTDSMKPMHLLPRSMQQEILAQQAHQAQQHPQRPHHDDRQQHERVPSLSLLQAAARASGASAVPAPAAFVNDGMTACPDCGKAIFSQAQHHCPAQFTDCPKCGERVALLAFDRHFLMCAAPSWPATRERREQERMLQRNAESLRAAALSSSNLRGSSGVFGGATKKQSFRRDGVDGRSLNLEQSFMFSEDVAKLLEKDLDEEADDEEEPVDANDFAAQRARRNEERATHSAAVAKGGSDSDLVAAALQRQQARDPQSVQRRMLSMREQQQRQEELQSAAPPGHRLCVLCRKPVREADMLAHLDQCDSNLLSCPLCLDGVPTHKLEEHQLVCPANRRRCFSCGGSIQFARLPAHVAECCTTGVRMTMFHGTTDKAAREIIKNGFLPSANGLLGEGVYMSQNVAKAKNYGAVILEAVVTIPSGKVLTVPALGHRLQKSWQRAGYDAAWMPPGVSKSGLEEHCIKNPKHIAVVGIVKE